MAAISAAGGGRRGRDPSGKLAGTLRDGSGTIRGRFEDGSRAFWRRKRGQAAPVNRARGASRHIGRLKNRRSVAGVRRFRGGRGRWGREPGPGGIVPGSFREAGRNLAGRFEGVLAAEARSDRAGEPGEGGEPVHRRLKTAAPLRELVDFEAGARGGGLGRLTGPRRSAGGGGGVPFNEFRVRPFWGVHLKPALPRPEPSQGPSAPSGPWPQTFRL